MGEMGPVGPRGEKGDPGAPGKDADPQAVAKYCAPILLNDHDFHDHIRRESRRHVEDLLPHLAKEVVPFLVRDATASAFLRQVHQEHIDKMLDERETLRYRRALDQIDRILPESY
jgi:hypothetical protein